MLYEHIRHALAEWGIEYFTVLSYSDCRESAPHIVNRENFTPRSVIVYLLPYYSGECENISAYAASRDYHIALREVNDIIGKCLDTYAAGCSYRGYGDHSPIDERHAALIGGLGILGKNGLLINEKYGTYVFIGDMITDIEPSALSAVPAREYSFCSDCGACTSACPTGVLRGECAECLSAITQRKGELNEQERALMRRYNTAWGCDLCQSACPYNANPTVTPIEFFHTDRIDRLTREMLDSMSAEEFRSRAFAWRGRSVVERNLDILDSQD